MKRFIQGEHRGQSTLLPESLDDYVSDTNPVRVVDVFVDELDLITLGFESAVPAETGRPAYHPAVMLRIPRSSGHPFHEHPATDSTMIRPPIPRLSGHP
ncbi:transposase, partial [Pseudomonas syringae]|uniref:transposase n=1 Tax=Pseudomonas syringae TaxID=317 RepID=UPI0034CF6BD3